MCKDKKCKVFSDSINASFVNEILKNNKHISIRNWPSSGWWTWAT